MRWEPRLSLREWIRSMAGALPRDVAGALGAMAIAAGVDSLDGRRITKGRSRCAGSNGQALREWIRSMVGAPPGFGTDTLGAMAIAAKVDPLDDTCTGKNRCRCAASHGLLRNWFLDGRGGASPWAC